jgi:hypothetical protein
MDLKTAFAYLLTGAYLWGYSFRAGLGVLVQFQWAAMGTDFWVFTAINLVGLGYFLAGAWFFVKMGLNSLSSWTKQFTSDSPRRR